MTNRETIAAQKASGTKGRFGTLATKTSDVGNRLTHLNIPDFSYEEMDDLAVELYEAGIRYVYLSDDRLLLDHQKFGEVTLFPDSPEFYDSDGDRIGQQVSENVYRMWQQINDDPYSISAFTRNLELRFGVKDAPEGTADRVISDWELQPGKHLDFVDRGLSPQDRVAKITELITDIQDAGYLPEGWEFEITANPKDGMTGILVTTDTPLYAASGPDGYADRTHLRFVDTGGGTVDVQKVESGDFVEARLTMLPKVWRMIDIVNGVVDSCHLPEVAPASYSMTTELQEGVSEAVYQNPEWDASEAEWAAHRRKAQQFLDDRNKLYSDQRRY